MKNTVRNNIFYLLSENISENKSPNLMQLQRSHHFSKKNLKAYSITVITEMTPHIK